MVRDVDTLLHEVPGDQPRAVSLALKIAHERQRVVVRLDVAFAIPFNEPVTEGQITAKIAVAGALVGFNIGNSLGDALTLEGCHTGQKAEDKLAHGVPCAISA